MSLEERLEQKLGELMEEQSSCTAKMFDPDMSKRISDLEWIRGRRWIKCTKCDVDLTLELCEHHKHRNGKLYTGDLNPKWNDET